MDSEELRFDGRKLFAGVYRRRVQGSDWEKLGKGYVGMKLQPVRSLARLLLNLYQKCGEVLLVIVSPDPGFAVVAQVVISSSLKIDQRGMVPFDLVMCC